MNLSKTASSFAALLAMTSAGAFCAALGFVAPPSPKPASALTYEKDILPLFQMRCLGCHGAGKAQAGLDLRTFGSLSQGGASGKEILPANPEKSPLYVALASGRMPPSPQKLSRVETLRVLDWIRGGAKGDSAKGGHWAFRAPVRPSVPNIEGAKNPIDAFLLSELRKKGLGFSPEADKKTLLRRLTYDLIGLPPSPEEIDAFLKDPAPNAYEKAADRLLADPRYGERWARRWLDIAGYADSEGVLQEDRIRPNAWRYRDYVIRSLNADKPYDQFLKEQIAGDEISDYRNAKKWTPEIEEMVTATGFLRTAVDATRDDFNEHQFTEYQYRMLHDTQTILVSATMGLTMQCARCHDHKYEPISQKDYYRIQAALVGAIRPKGKLLPTYRRQIVAGTAEDQKHAQEVNAQVNSALQALAQREALSLRTYRMKFLESRIANLPDAERSALRLVSQTEDAKRTPEQKALAAKRKDLLEPSPETLRNAFADYAKEQTEIANLRGAEEKRRITLPEIRALYDQDAAPPPAQLLHRGEYQKPGEAIEPGVPAVLADPKRPFALPKTPPNAQTTGRRRALAEWIARAENPLTARVIVNRIWERHFGEGIVASVENLGRSGKPPVNPQLLDWLACELAAGVRGAKPWSLKALHRLMVLSRAYRQSSAFRPEAAKRDPSNRLLWRQRVQRLEAEAIRDGMLATAGNLDSTLFGEPVNIDVRGTGEVVPIGEEGRGRRSLYLQVRRTLPVTLLNVFDAPVMETNCTRRVASATPTQALTLLNSSFMASQSVHFAKRVFKEIPIAEIGKEYATLGKRVERASRLAFGRAPSETERRASVGFVQEQTLRYRKLNKRPDEAELQAFADLCLALLSANEFVYLD